MGRVRACAGEWEARSRNVASAVVDHGTATPKFLATAATAATRRHAAYQRSATTTPIAATATTTPISAAAATASAAGGVRRRDQATERYEVVTTQDRQETAAVDETMTLTEHLGELRVRIIRSALAVIVGMVLIIAFYNQVLEFLEKPYRDLCESKPADFCEAQLNTFSPTEGLSTRIRVGMYGGILMALPVILWQVWRFIVPALHAKERKYAVPFVVSSVVLFLAGGALAYYSVGQALEFLISWSGAGVDQVFSVSSYVSLIGLMFFAFGIGFLLPVLIVFLQLVGVVQPRTLLKSWRYALVGIAVTAAVITPSGDPVTLMLLGGPMFALYFVAVLIGWLVLRKRPLDA